VVAGKKANNWLEKQQSRLKESGVAIVIQELKQHIEAEEVSDGEAPVRVCHSYMSNHQEQMNDQTAIAVGLPIGSSEVEGGGIAMSCKND
jgi:hypothetical protein